MLCVTSCVTLCLVFLTSYIILPLASLTSCVTHPLMSLSYCVTLPLVSLSTCTTFPLLSVTLCASFPMGSILLLLSSTPCCVHASLLSHAVPSAWNPFSPSSLLHSHAPSSRAALWHGEFRSYHASPQGPCLHGCSQTWSFPKAQCASCLSLQLSGPAQSRCQCSLATTWPQAESFGGTHQGATNCREQ